MPDAGVDAGADAGDPPPEDAGSPVDAGADASEPDAWSRPDAGPDLGPLGCAMPGVAVPVEMPFVGEEWTATLDPSLRADYHTTSCATRAAVPDVVLALTPGSDGHLVIETTDPDLDTVLAVRVACEDPTTEVACNDDALVGGGPSRVSLDVEAGVTLYVIVDARGEPRPIPIHARLLPLRAADEACDPLGALDACVEGTTCAGEPPTCRALTEGGCPPSGAFIDLDPLLVDRRARYEGTLEGRSDDAAAMGCEGEALAGGAEVVHRLTLPFRAKIDAIAFGLDANVLYVRTDCGDPSTEVLCEGWGGILAERSPIFEEGAEVFFFVEAREDAGGLDYTLIVDLDRVVADGEPCAVTGLGIDRCEASSICRDEGGAERVCRPVLCGDGYTERDEVCDAPLGVDADGCSDSCVRDDSCASPIDLNLFGTPDGSALTYRGTNLSSSDRVRPACATMAGGNDILFVYTAPAAGTLTVDTGSTETSFDTVLALLAGDCTGTSLACNDDIMSGNTRSRVTTTVTAGQRVFVVVDGFRAESRGTYVLRVDLTP